MSALRCAASAGCAAGPTGARRLAASFEADLAALGARAGPALRAATFHPSAYSSSAGSLADAIMAAAGMRNIAAERGLTGLSRLAGLGRGLDALGLGEDAAASMGVSLGRLRVMAVLGTASAVGGAIGFVGLVVAHLLRPLVGGRPSRLMPAAALGGAAMLLAAMSRCARSRRARTSSSAC